MRRKQPGFILICAISLAASALGATDGEITPTNQADPAISTGLDDIDAARGESFEFTVSGPLVDKLEPGTRLLIWSPIIETKSKWLRASVEDLPVAVPYTQLSARHAWIASFVSPTDHRFVMSIGLAPALFDKPRRIDLKLERAHTRIRPSCLGRLQFQYYSGITQRMWYYDLPFWDKERRRMVVAKPPLMRVVRASDGVIVQESKMEEGCMGSKWWASIDRPLDLGDKTDLQLVVQYDSGGLWGTIETKLDFTYHKKLHGF